MLASCGAQKTALVLEAVSYLPPGALDDVVFRVNGDGLPGGAREAVAPLTGPGAKNFPLQLALVADDETTGAFAVTVQGRTAGQVTALGIPEDAAPIAFVPGEVVTRRF